MTVPALLMLPRMTARSDDDTNVDTPAMQYLHSLRSQRNLASAATVTTTVNPGGGAESGGHHLSEPLMLRSLLCEWYACTSNADVVAFQNKYRVNRSALRLVDSAVAQCAERLSRLIAPDSPNSRSSSGIQDGAEELCGEHDVAVRRPSTQAVAQLIDATLPQTYRTVLTNSLLRLRRCALEHAGHRLSQRFGSMTHWYPQDEQLMRQLQPQVGRRRGGSSKSRPKLALGATQQRLCAAFVAAFARHTMRGEDGSHRVHHRRLVRNLGTLQEDADRTCSFGIDIHAQNQQQQQQRQAAVGVSPHDRLTPDALRCVLSPYLAGTQLCQLELFANGRSAVARFGEDAENGDKKDAELVDEEGRSVEVQRQQALLAPCVLPFEPAAGPAQCSVVLAHIGISLLVSIQSALTRLTLLLPPSSTPSSSSGRINSGDTAGVSVTRPGQNTVTTITSSNRGLRFTSLDEEGRDAPNVRVAWHDSYGQECFLLLSEVRHLGYEKLFPTPSPTTASAAHIAPGAAAAGKENDAAAAVVGAGVAGEADISTGAASGSMDEPVLMSVQRVFFTRAVCWKVTLPTARVEPWSGSSVAASDDMCHYCWVCHSTWLKESAFRSHCRSLAHLSRLALVVRLGMRREWVAAFSSGTMSDLLLRCSNSNSGNGKGMEVELRHCTVSSTSFLNALQWCPRGDEASATMPIAIAGSLVANASAALAEGGLPSSGSGLALQALHVWVLDTDQGATAGGAQADSLTSTHLPLSLFVLAGYLAAASSSFTAALLMNRDHSRAHAVMLYDWGVWRFPIPLTRTQLRSVFEVFAGRSWRGVPADDSGGAAPDVEDHDAEGESCGGQDAEADSLHWCVVSDKCPQCTYCGCGGNAVEKTLQDKQQRDLRSDAPSADEVVESTLLLVLYEYKNSQRSVVSFADYTQRVVAKLNAWSLLQQQQHEHQRMDATARGHKHAPSRRAAASAAVEWRGGAELLARLVARRQNQPLESLLRDLGCQFLTPPTALTAAAAAAPAVSFSASALAAEGTTNEKLFLLPRVLPSYLPSPDFAALLRRHRQSVRDSPAVRKGAALMAREKQGTAVAAAAAAGVPQQPSF
ncbi:putative helicase [Trypanosoma grayi]|uniref:putative helicase n=1 Tax=Trypanosoma grayi TaxID=71804 RepID=UPI0004F41025|nr:putative helicase [Trypanosoma grayi]KEG07440.1 putative helicase [Trypanosoma grayi]